MLLRRRYSEGEAPISEITDVDEFFKPLDNEIILLSNSASLKPNKITGQNQGLMTPYPTGEVGQATSYSQNTYSSYVTDSRKSYTFTGSSLSLYRAKYTCQNAIGCTGGSFLSNKSNFYAIILPETVTEIGGSAFQNASNLNTVVITSRNSRTQIFNRNEGGVSRPIETHCRINGNAFTNCYNLRHIVIFCDNCVCSSLTPFTNLTKSNITLYVPARAKSFYQQDYFWSQFIAEGESLKTLNEWPGFI